MCKAIEDMLADSKKTGIDVVNELNKKLAEQGRVDDIVRAATEQEYQKKLMDEFDLKYPGV